MAVFKRLNLTPCVLITGRLFEQSVYGQPYDIDNSMSHCALSVSPHLRVMRLAGFFAPGARRTLQSAYQMFTLCVICTYTLQQSVFGYQKRRDLDKLSQVMFLMLVHITCITKKVVFHSKADEINKLIASLDEPLLNQSTAAARAQLDDAARLAARLLRVFSGCSVATCILWIVFPVVYRLQGRYIEFAFWTGFNYDHIGLFSAVLVYSCCITNLVAIGNTAMDAFISAILGLCRAQLRILRQNFEVLPESAAAACAATGERYDAALQRLLVDCLVHYKKTIELCGALQEIFSMPMLVQFGVAGWILCMAAYNMISLNVLSIEFASNALFVICILIELLLYCYFGNEVTVESNRVSESIYGMQWSRAPLWFQRSLLVVLERAKRPMSPAAGLVIPLSLNTFVTMLKSSYSFYAVLRQTKEADKTE